MSESTHRTHSNHLEFQGEQRQQQQKSMRDEEDDVRSVRQIISLYNANKINKSNVWNCELIDKLDLLVKQHNVYIRNFRNIGMSLDATMKVYEIRVDSVCNDVRRLGVGITSASKQNSADTDSMRMSNHAINENESTENMSQIKRKMSKKRKLQANIAIDTNRLNAPLDRIPLPDDLTSKLNLINNDTGASNRLFITVLPTKQSSLRLNSGEKFIDSNACDTVQFHDHTEYSVSDEDFIALPCNIGFVEQALPIRPIASGLSGYRIKDTPMDEDNDSDEDDFNVEPYIPPDYAFDMNDDVAFPYRPTGSTLSQNNPNHDLPNGAALQDLNNNGGISFDGMEFDNVHGNNDDDNNNNNLNNINQIQLLKGEYAYQVFSNIRNFWAGPSYWKYSKNLNKNVQAQIDDNKVGGGGRRKRKHAIKPSFCGLCDDGESSMDDVFIKLNSKAAKKLRHCNRSAWNGERNKLPPKFDFARDFFDKLNHNRQSNDSMASDQMDNFDADAFDDDGFGQLNVDHDVNQGEFTDNSFQIGLHQNISQHAENPPLVVEKIPINFDKRAKVVNMQRMYNITLWSLERQFDNTKSMTECAACDFDTKEEFEPGKALFSEVFKDLRVNQRKFMDRGSELTTGLVLSSVLKAANEQRLRFGKRPNSENDFPIAKIRRIE